MELILSFASGASQLQKSNLTSANFGSLHIELGNLWVRFAPFAKMPQLYDHASFDWGSASSEHHLATSWTQDLQQHATVYQQLTAKLGPNHPMDLWLSLFRRSLTRTLKSHLSKGCELLPPKTSLWQETAKSFHRTLGEVVQRVEQITLEPEEALASFAGRKRHHCLCQFPPQQLRYQNQPQDEWMAAWPACRVVTATFRHT